MMSPGEVRGGGLDNTWRKSRRSLSNGNCVEVRLVGDRVEMRDSANPSGHSLKFGRAQFSVFIAAVANREFERP
jgi:hypothetical protein